MMVRKKWLGMIVVLAALGVPAIARGAQAGPISVYLGGMVGGQSQEVTLVGSGLQDFSVAGTSGILLYGAEAGFGLPLGIRIGGHYLRHSNEFGEEIVQSMVASPVDAWVDMAGNEWGADLEWHLGLIPGSPLQPFIGVGASYAHVTLDGTVRFETFSEALVTNTDVYRAYGIAGLKFGNMLGASVRGGWAFSEEKAARADYDFAGQSVSVSADYNGYYVAGSVTLEFH
jgi:hypothetical protein